MLTKNTNNKLPTRASTKLPNNSSCLEQEWVLSNNTRLCRGMAMQCWGKSWGFMGIWIRGYGWTGLGTVTCNYAQTLFRFVRSGKWRVNIIFEKTELCNEGMAPMWRSKLTCIACMFFLARQSISANFWFSQFKCRSAPPKPESI